MNEKRKYPRLNTEMAVKCFLMDGRNKKKVSYQLVSKVRNLSEGGLCITWPKGWNCKSCLKCLAWAFNDNCKLKEEFSSEEANRFLSRASFVKVRLEPPAVARPVKLLTKVAWVDEDPQDREYEVGLSLVKRLNGNSEKIQVKNSSFF